MGIPQGDRFCTAEGLLRCAKNAINFYHLAFAAGTWMQMNQLNQLPAIAVIGLGYVGLPLAVEFGNVIGGCAVGVRDSGAGRVMISASST